MSDFKTPRELELEKKVAELEQENAELEQENAELKQENAELKSNEPARKKPALSIVAVDKIAYIYHFYNPISELFVYHGFSELYGMNAREYVHVKAGSFCGEFLSYSEEQQRDFGVKLLEEARACISLNSEIYTYKNFNEYKPESVGRIGDCKGSCGGKGVELFHAGYCKACQKEYKASLVQIGICKGKVKDENGKTLFGGCNKNKPLENQKDEFCKPCNRIAWTWKNRAVCQRPNGNGCTNSNSSDKNAVVPIVQKTPQKMCNACKLVYKRAKKKASK